MAGAASGLFADYDLDVEIVDPPSGPGTEVSKAVARGEADACLTGTTYFHMAAAEAAQETQRFPARFLGAIHQTSPLAAIVAADSGLTEPADLAGKRAAGSSLSWLVKEAVAALIAQGVEPPQVTATEKHASEAVRDGEVDMQCTFADALPSAEKRAGVPMRAIPLGTAVYASGLVAGDHVPGEVAQRLRDALADSVRLQAKEPEAGSELFTRRYPQTTAEHALASWAMFEPYALGHHEPVSMDHQRWHATTAHTAAVHGIPAPAPEAVYRPELAVGGANTEEELR